MLVVARKAAGLTQVEVALHLDKLQSFVSKYEHGERRLDFTEFMEIADNLSVDVSRFSSLNNWRSPLHVVLVVG
jgi:transcriptional regulator with XRE-family HTH domain